MRVYRPITVAATLVALALAAPGAAPASADPAPEECDVVGTDGDDVIYGYDFPVWWAGGADIIYASPERPEVICGLGGNDRIIAFTGDVVYGGPGDDDIWNGAAARRLYGGEGDDRLIACVPYECMGDRREATMFGGPGADTLSGKGGRDLLRGGDGDDVLVGSGNDDWLYGGPGDDELVGWWGADHLYGGHGHDKLEGGKNNDVLVGGTGRDELWGGPGNDWMFGRRGADVLYGREQYDDIRKRDRLEGGPGFDRGTWDEGLDRRKSVEKRAED